ncbi:DNA-nicking Smr family endonuclease [Pseudochelatococcus lubricantis]|uniref:DNA-nicking Smr family endonuclease n=1 Tax=Pseudochelatococcus lubricantis TaxID=1538102 RepID=A0ABX0UZK6_9HYPH|nr:Smr/MutS family protein [Pseudochelatococcus lubricantis]NIJ58397.1 DNA-nicking Smr family endonuclease [Pseudochelatococcus lubricantis]
MKRRGGRRLSEEEAKLWRHVTRSIRPLPGHTPPLEPAPAPEAEATSPEHRPAEASPPAKIERRPPAPPPLVPLERRLMRDLRRGIDRIDARIDLHGMRQNEAYYALLGFLRRAQGEGARVALVVTGKGSTAAAVADPFSERGVLRRLVPHWLGLAEMRPVVVGFSTASREHGGDGALYVRLRKGAKGRPGGEARP